MFRIVGDEPKAATLIRSKGSMRTAFKFGDPGDVSCFHPLSLRERARSCPGLDRGERVRLDRGTRQPQTAAFLVSPPNVARRGRMWYAKSVTETVRSKADRKKGDWYGNS